MGRVRSHGKKDGLVGLMLRRVWWGALAVLCITSIASNPSVAGPILRDANQMAKERRVSPIVPIQAAHEPDAIDRSTKAAAIDTYLRHAYTVYFGLRACSELKVEQNDNSFVPSVSIEEARRTLKAIDAASAEVRVDTTAPWAAAAPQAAVTAEALKANPGQHVEHCHQMGGLFRNDVSNLQRLLQSLGAKTAVLSKDF